MAAIAEVNGVVTSSPIALSLSACILAKAARLVGKFEAAMGMRRVIEGHMGDADLRDMVK